MTDLNHVTLLDGTETTLVELGERYGRQLAYSPINEDNYTTKRIQRWLDDYVGIKDDLKEEQLSVIALCAQRIPPAQ